MFIKQRVFTFLLVSFLCLTSGVFLLADDQKSTPSFEKIVPEKEYVEPYTGMKFVFVEGGCYEMGDHFGDGELDERPIHEVCVDDLYFGKYEVTNIEFRNFAFETGYVTSAEKFGKGYAISSRNADDTGLKAGVSWKHPLWPADRVLSKMDHPVVQVSIIDAFKFAKWLSLKTGQNFRLPTEAEWEYVARNRGKKYKYSWGNGKPTGNIADDSVHKVKRYKRWSSWDGYNDNYVYTAPVGTFDPNELGIYDLSGNVSEWCSDVYDFDYYKKDFKENPKGPKNGKERVLRGGSWNYKPYYLRCSNRMAIFPNNWSFYIGIRLVKTP